MRRTIPVDTVRSARIAIATILSVAATAALAIHEDHPAGRFEHLTRQRIGGLVRIRAERVSSLPAGDALRREWDRVATERGGGWRVWLDRRSGLPTLVTVDGAVGLQGSAGEPAADLDGIAALARSFLQSHGSVLGSWGDQAILDRKASGPLGPEVWLVRFVQVVDGVPVEGAHYDFYVSHGKLASFGARRWAPVRTSPVPLLNESQARARLDAYVGAVEDDGVVYSEGSELVLLPLDADPQSKSAWTARRGQGYVHRLIRRFRFTDREGIATWTGEVDAHNGEIVAFYDSTRYQTIKGHVHPVSDDGQCEIGGCPGPGFPMPFVGYTVDGGTVQIAGQHGSYSCAGPQSAIATTLEGQYFRVVDVCGPILETTTCGADLDLGVADDINCGVALGDSAGNTDAARSAYFTANSVARKARFWMPGNSWLAAQHEVETNLDETCQAYGGSSGTSFARAGDGCGNMAQIQGVVVHEFGHGLDFNDGGAQWDNPYEGYADVVAILESRSSCVGRGFYTGQPCGGFGDPCLTCTGVREVDWDARQSHTPATPRGFVSDFCGDDGDGPCGGQNHCEGMLVGETIFDLATRDLPAMGLDLDTAWQLVERLWYQTRPGSGGDAYNCSNSSSDSCDVGTWYHRFRVLDDDDGNLNNGTPHAAAIFAAFDRHDIACGNANDAENQNSSSCPTLAAPAPSFETRPNAVSIDWDPVSGANAYRVYRNEIGCDRSQFPIVQVGGSTTDYVDTELANGVPVFYRVQAIGINTACESPVSACVETVAERLAGRVTFSRPSYGCSDEIVLEVTDANHPASQIAVTIVSDTETVPETVVLTETEAGSFHFTGSILTITSPASADGLLSVAAGDSITVEYVDQDDGEGGTDVATQAVAAVDCAAPVIFAVRETGVSDVAATIEWSTDEPANSRVAFGVSVPPSGEAAWPVPVTSHALGLTGLSPCTVHHYSVESTDGVGNLAVRDNQGQYFHFETFVDLGSGLRPCHQGGVDIESEAVACASSVPVRLWDVDPNDDPGLADTVVLALTSTSEAVAESVVLTETGPDTSIFSGSIPTATGVTVNGDGTLQVASGDLLTATYRDADDGSGGPRFTFDTAVVDCGGPQHLSVWVSDITDGTAVVNWTTSEPATGHVDWGTTPALGNVVASATPATSHAVSIGTVGVCDRVHFRVTSTDAQGNVAVADSNGVPFELNVGTVGGTIVRDGFETDLGWTLQGEWEIGAPAGLGAPGDPAAAIVGGAVLGHDLSGQGTYPGDYEPLTTQSATSPAFDVSGLSSAEIRFERWLNVVSGGIASIEVKDQVGQWAQVWVSPGGVLSSSSWSVQSYDVSPYVAGNTSFQVRFRQQSLTAFAHRSGWNVDELVLRDSTFPLIVSCGACGGAPTFGGVASATDDDPCAATGVTLTWSDAPAWGTGSAGTYAVYRDTQPGFVPSGANRVASGITGTTWTDAAAPTGATLHYVVRAENDETCGGGPNNGGLEDGNLIYAAVMNETAQPAPGDVGATLLVDVVNHAHVRLAWAPAQDAAAYRVHRSSSADTGFAAIGQPVGTLYDDAGGFGDGLDAYYLVRSVDACGNESAD